MKEWTSQRLVLAEAIVLLAPLTALTTGYAVLLIALYSDGPAKEPWDAQIVPAFTFLGLILQACGWWAIGVFLLRGRAGIARLHPACVVAMSLGAVLAIAGGVSFALLFFVQDTRILAVLGINAFGLPALVPFAHLVLERRRARSGLPGATARSRTPAG